MIPKDCFVRLLDNFLKPYSSQLDLLEKGLGVHVADGWLVDTFDKVISTLSDMCFDEETLNNNPYDFENNKRIIKDREFKADREAVEDIIYHYCFNACFGEQPEQLDRLLVISEPNNTEPELAWSPKNAQELYDVVEAWIHRDGKYNCLLDTSIRRVQ